MNKYLIEILKLRTSVTLPGFGALMIANSRTGKIVLNQLLKYDDKVLAKFIVEKENIDIQEAQNMVSKFIKEIDLDLSKGETYDIFNFGKLSKTENGSIVFEMDESMKKEQAVTPIVPLPKAEKKSVEKNETLTTKVETKPVIKKETPAPKVEKKKVEKKEVVTPIVKEKEIPNNVYTPPLKPKTETAKKPVDVKENKVVESTKVVTKTVVKKTSDKKEKDVAKVIPIVGENVDSKVITVKTEAVSLTKKEKIKQEKEANKKWQDTKLGNDDDTKKRKIWPWILLLLLIGLGITIFLYQDKVKAMLGMTHEVEQVDTVNVEEPVVEKVIEDVVATEAVVDTLTDEEYTEAELVDENENEIIETIPAVQSSINGSYHIVGGAFAEQANADAFALKVGGVVIGRFNGIYQVAIKSFDTKREANSAFSSISSEYDGAWLFKYPK